MDKKSLAEKYRVSLKTIYNWEKNKPELIKAIKLNDRLDEAIKEIEEILSKLKQLKNN